jgi:signal transduction histidine kinase
VQSFAEEAEYHWYAALARAAHYDAASSSEREQLHCALVGHLHQLETWASACPENFGNRAALVAAEIARIHDDPEKAAKMYDAAILSARDNGFVQSEAVGYETAARFYRARGFDFIADAYLREARDRYLRWGADGKVRLLELLYPQLSAQAAFGSTMTLALRTEQLDLLSVARASQAISRETDPDKLIRALLEGVLEQGGAQTACLLMNRDGTLALEAVSTLDAKGSVTTEIGSASAGSSQRLPWSLVNYVHRTKQRVILNSTPSGLGKFSGDEYFAARQTPRSLLCMPIVRRGEIVGVLYSENNLAFGTFTLDRLVALELLTAQAAISLDNAWLLARERAARAAAEDAGRRTAFLAEAGALLSESLDYEQTLARVSRLCVRSIADFCIIDILEDRTIRRLVGEHADRTKEPALKELERRYPVHWDSPHPAAAVIRTGQPVVVPKLGDDVLRSLCVDDEHARIIRDLGTRSVLAVPLVTRGQTMGALTLGSSDPERQFGDADVELAAEVARRAAAAIDNARHYREARNAIQLRDEFVSIASHELRTPITSLSLVVQSLERDGRRGGQSSSAELLAIAARQTKRLTALVSELLDVARITSGRMALTLERYDFALDLRQIVERVRAQAEEAKAPIRVYGVDSLIVRWDRSRIDQLVTNLLSNAIAYGAGQPIDVDLQCTGGEAKARITVRDRGIGIPADRLPYIFERFERATSTRHYGGLGLGLFIARRIAEAHGGSISVESQVGRGSTFSVELPLDPESSTATVH